MGVYEKGSTALELLTIMWQNIAMKSKKEIDVILRGTHVTLPGNAKKKYPSQIPFVAAERGNTRFVIELIRLYPDLIWKVNDTNQSIFHTAAEHRHMDIYNLLYEIGSKRNQITLLKDANENNMLHLVGKSAKKKRHEDVSGAAFEMQRELLWFKVHIPPRHSRVLMQIVFLFSLHYFIYIHEYLILKNKLLRDPCNKPF